jgi:hypothetical protein
MPTVLATPMKPANDSWLTLGLQMLLAMKPLTENGLHLP